MSLLKQILSPFIEFNEEQKKPTSPIPQAAPTPVNQPINEAESHHPLVTGAEVQNEPVPQQRGLDAPLQEHKNYFEKLIDEANIKNPLFAGTDYKEFIDSKMDIDNIADEETRYKTAFNVLKRTGLTKEKLISTANEYHNLIGRDLNAFQGAHGLQFQKEVRQREQLIQQKAEQLQALTEKINALKKEISQLSQQMVETKDRLSRTKNSFLLAGENKQQEIQDELKKIIQFFGN